MRRKSETGQYRHAVDKGRTHDKIAAPDPAAAPLHTDAESSGYPTARAALAAVAADQARVGGDETPVVSSSIPGRGQGQIPSRRTAWLLGGAFAALGALGLLAALLSPPPP